MKELKCPKCGSVFSVDEADYSFILQQVKTAEFNAEVDRRLGELLKKAHGVHLSHRSYLPDIADSFDWMFGYPGLLPEGQKV